MKGSEQTVNTFMLK